MHPPKPLPAVPLPRRGLSLRTKLMLGLILIIGSLFAGLNAYNALANLKARRAEALTTSGTLARLVAGGLLSELGNNGLDSPQIHTFLHNFLHATFTLNAANKELAFILVVDNDNRVVGGQARPELTVFPGGMQKQNSDAVLAEIAHLDGPLGPNMALMRFPLKVGEQGAVGRLLVGTSLARVEADGRQELVRSGTCFLCALALLIFYTSWAIDHMVVTPMQQVVAAMQRVQEGHLDTELVVTRTDEMGVLAAAYNFMVRGLRDRAKLQDAFSRYVSKQVYMKFQAGEIELAGEKRQATVLFSDIRSFTTLSEQMDPNDVVNMLNEYFTVMVESIFKYDGFLNKFIGDAIMAVYNVPLDQSLPELRAVRTALEMRDNLLILNSKRAEKTLAPLKMGIGINTGPVVAGNIGHQKRLEYTVIGDAVNLAQRLESQTKESGVSILVSASTWQAVCPYVDGAALEPVHVKGKSEPVALYRIDAIKAGAPMPA